MKIALLAPAGAMHRYNGSFGKSLHYAPLTLTTLASLVPEELEVDIKIYDETVEKTPFDLDLICMTCITGTALLKPKGYITKNTLEAVRGCNLPCTFCAYLAAFGKTVYKRPVKEVVKEIEMFGSKIILFPDVNLLADRDYAIKLFTELIPLKKFWLGLATSHIGFDEEIVSLFEKSGCKGLLIGLESVSQTSQKYINKGVNKVEDYELLIKILHNSGIPIQGCFAFGADDEDESVFERTVEMLIKSKIDLPRYSILTPFPKTEYYRQLEAENRIFEHNWSMYDVEHYVFQPKLMTPEKLSKGTEWVWRETYKSFNIVKRLAPFNLAPWLLALLNMGYKGYSDKFSKFNRDVMCDNSDISTVLEVQN